MIVLWKIKIALPRSCPQPKKRASCTNSSSSNPDALFTLSGSHFRTRSSMISAVSRRCIQSGSHRLLFSGSVLPARSRDRSSIRLIFAPFLMGRVSHVVSIADNMSHNPYFHGFISGNEKQPVRSILIRSAFPSCHTLISVSKIRLCLSAVNGTAQIHQSSEKELSSLCKKPPRLPASETGAVRLLYGFLFALFKRSHHHLRGVLIAAWAGAKIAERSEQ